MKKITFLVIAVLMFALTIASASAQDSTINMYWEMDFSNGTGAGAPIYDTIGNVDLHGDTIGIVGSPNITSIGCVEDNCSDYSLGSYEWTNGDGNTTVQIPSTSDWTFNAWIKATDATPPATHLFAHLDTGQQTYFGITTSGFVSYAQAGGTPTSNVSLTDNTWHMVTIVQEVGVSDRIYIDGVLTATDSGTTDYDVGWITLGGSNGALTEFTGYMDEVMIWNRTLSDTEIQAIHNGSVNGSGWCNPYSNTCSIIDTDAPDDLTGLSNISQDNQSVLLNWSNPVAPDYTHSEVYYNVSGGGLIFVANVSSGGNVYNVTGLTNDTLYTFQMRPVDNESNKGNYSTTTTTTYPNAVAPSVEWDGLMVYNKTYQATDFNLSYNVTGGDLNVSCNLTIDSTFNQSQVSTSLGVSDFSVGVSSLNDGAHQFQVDCSNDAGTGSTSVKTIFVDKSQPSLTINNPPQNSSHFDGDGLPVNVTANNTELLEFSIVLYDSTGAVTFNDTTENVTGATASRDYVINTSDLVVGDMNLVVYVSDEVGFNDTTNLSLRIYGCSEKVENWTANYTACSVYDNQTLEYYDANSCDTTYDVPVDNGTEQSCNYCTADINVTQTECVAGVQNATYTITNYGSCCAVTNISADCTVPANTSVSCTIGTYETSDITGLVIDFGVEFGVEMIALAGVIALIGVISFAVYLFRR